MIVGCAAYSGGVAIEGSDRPRAAVAAAGDGAFAWIGLLEPSLEELQRVVRGLGLPQRLLRQASTPHARPLLEVEDDTVLVVLRPARYVNESEVIDLGEVAVLLHERAVVTLRRGPFSHVRTARRVLEADPERLAAGPFAVLQVVAGRTVAQYGEVLRLLFGDIEAVEREVFTPGGANPLQRIFQLKRELLDFQAAATVLVYLLEDLGDGTVLQVPDGLRPGFQAVREQLQRQVDRANGYRDLLMSVLVSYQTEISLRQNEDMRRISAWVAICAAPTLIAGIYGMNFERMPELRSAWGYPITMLVIVAIMVGLYVGFRRRGWLARSGPSPVGPSSPPGRSSVPLTGDVGEGPSSRGSARPRDPTPP